MTATLRATYIGEAVAAAGFALVGVRTVVAPLEADALWRAIRAARKDSELVILNQAHADVVGKPLRDLIVAEPEPPIAVIASMDSTEPAVDRVVDPARRVLGLG